MLPVIPLQLVLQTPSGRTVALSAPVRMVASATLCQEPAAVPRVSVEPTVRMVRVALPSGTLGEGEAMLFLILLTSWDLHTEG